MINIPKKGSDYNSIVCVRERIKAEDWKYFFRFAWSLLSGSLPSATIYHIHKNYVKLHKTINKWLTKNLIRQVRVCTTRWLKIRNLSSIEETIAKIDDLEIPSLFSTEISHSIPVPQSTNFTTGTLAPMMGKTPETCPLSVHLQHKNTAYKN